MWQAQHLVRRDSLSRGRRGALTLRRLLARAWALVGPGCICVAGASLSASGATFVWQAQRFVRRDLFLQGRRGTLTLSKLLVRAWVLGGPGCICLAGASLSASGATFVWQAQHFVRRESSYTTAHHTHLHNSPHLTHLTHIIFHPSPYTTDMTQISFFLSSHTPAFLTHIATRVGLSGPFIFFEFHGIAEPFFLI